MPTGIKESIPRPRKRLSLQGLKNLSPSTIFTRKKQSQKNSLCVVCMERSVTHILYPCGHSCLCETCATNHLSELENRCPVGRCHIQDVIKVWGNVVANKN